MHDCQEIRTKNSTSTLKIEYSDLTQIWREMKSNYIFIIIIHFLYVFRLLLKAECNG